MNRRYVWLIFCFANYVPVAMIAVPQLVGLFALQLGVGITRALDAALALAPVPTAVALWVATTPPRHRFRRLSRRPDQPRDAGDFLGLVLAVTVASNVFLIVAAFHRLMLWRLFPGPWGFGLEMKAVVFATFVAPVANFLLLRAVGVRSFRSFRELWIPPAEKAGSVSEEGPPERRPWAAPAGLRIGWAIVSSVGMALGAAAAVWLFPEAAAPKSLGMLPKTAAEPGAIGKSAAQLLAALVVGAGLALGQLVPLARLIRIGSARRAHAHSLFVVPAWAIATVIGVVLALLPLWRVSLTLMVGEPFLGSLILVPGLVVLGVCQGAIVESTGGAMGRWAVATVLGGQLAAYLCLSEYKLLPYGDFEVAAACAVGLGVGSFQSIIAYGSTRRASR